SDRIFLVINAKDEITEEIQQALPKIRENAHQFLEQISPGSSQHCQQFIVSAWAALQAQKSIKGEPIDARDKYAGVQRSLRITDGNDQAVLRESHIPKLTEALNSFVKMRIDRQLRFASRELFHVLEGLVNTLVQEKELLTQGQGDRYRQKQINQLLKDRQDDIETLIREFRGNQLAQLPMLNERLYQVSNAICDEVDSSLQAEMPRYWKNNFDHGTYLPEATLFARVKKEQFLGEIEVNLWDLLGVKVHSLAQEVTRGYETAMAVYDLPQRIAELGFGKISLDAIEQQFQTGVDVMSNHLINAVRGFAISPLTNPENQFLNFSDDALEHNSSILDVLRQTMPLEQDLSSAHFYDLIRAIRNHYEVSIHDVCLNSLLNLYRYEIMCIERKALDFLFEQFELLRSADDITLEVLTGDNSEQSKWLQLESIDRQLGVIRSIKDQLALTIS
ncbi:MAG: hypothetical protein F6K11_27695, partial [Leptolyngbya sp. SIO3F4]|nr:hypothetical protein [Leptolyngbya sp. SIO3F4]